MTEVLVHRKKAHVAKRVFYNYIYPQTLEQSIVYSLIMLCILAGNVFNPGWLAS